MLKLCQNLSTAYLLLFFHRTCAFRLFQQMPVLVAGQPLNREETLTLLRNRLDLLNRTVSNRRVEVTDYAQIQESETKVNESLSTLSTT